MTDKEFQEILRKGQDELEQWQRLTAELALQKAQTDASLARMKQEWKDDPYRKKLDEAASLILDRVIERNQPKPALAATSEAAKVKQPLKLPPKKQDLSRYFDGLTEAQREAASLYFEYDLPVTKIAKHLGISRPAVDERISAAKNKMELERSFLKRQAARRNDQ